MNLRKEINKKLESLFDGIIIKTDFKTYPGRIFFFKGEKLLFFLWTTSDRAGEVSFSSYNTIIPIIDELRLPSNKKFEIVLEELEKFVNKTINAKCTNISQTLTTPMYQRHFNSKS